jgi:carbon catabolite-derepressing protein kinase
MNLTMGNLEVNTGDLLGAGGFGRVYRGRNKTTGEILAVKEIDCSRVAREKVLLEIKLMEFINGHPSFIGLRAAQEVTDTASIYIFMELAEGGELFERVIRDGKLTEQEATRYFSQIMSGVEQLHAQGIVHRDLKLENVRLPPPPLTPPGAVTRARAPPLRRCC